MASGVMRCVLSNLLEPFSSRLEEQEGGEITSKFPRTTKVVRFGTLLLQKTTENSDFIDAFDDFSEKMVKALNNIVKSGPKCRSLSAKREIMWSSFHQFRLSSEYCKIWEDLLKSLGLYELQDKLLQQSVTFSAFKMLITEHFSSSNTSQVVNSMQEYSMSKDELNALQYIGGYIPHALLKKLEKKSESVKYDKFIECLGNMAVVSDDDHENLLDYTKEWIGKVNRGGLFPLNNLAFIFFIAVEKQVKTILPNYVIKRTSKSIDDFKSQVIENVVKDADVQWYWTLLSQDIDSEDDAVELLTEVIKLWVTVRGFSLVNTWMETYKIENKTATKKSKGLRKELQSSK